ncbi:SPW repeat domain-containing protein [Amycolatopsis sp. H20-H5]|uniref:SPW repeat domain-containing protein n=1 Tax=Amycolatopsis sp. H20-H5 TaxID=3046309 RepID=UPI002DBC9ADD|nr:hypothetical protein [Amycolatopsis sp. H20-H5]
MLAVIDGLTFAVGVWLALSSFTIDLDHDFTNPWNDGLVGTCLAVLGASSLISGVGHGWFPARIPLAAWLITTPFVVGYTDTPMASGTTNDIVTGAIALSLGLSGVLERKRTGRRV